MYTWNSLKWLMHLYGGQCSAQTNPLHNKGPVVSNEIQTSKSKHSLPLKGVCNGYIVVAIIIIIIIAVRVTVEIC
jgi:hypothetical protein